VGVRHRSAIGAVGSRERRLTVIAGVLLAAHFATWIPSIRLTSVASSVALVCTQPVWAVALAARAGERPGRRTVSGVLVAFAGVVVLSGVDLSVSARALGGDALALAGGALAAGYMHVGAEVRRTVPNPVYTLGCYGLAGVLLGLACVGSGADLVGFDARTWWLIVALTVGPQLLGHSVFNRVLPAVGATVVSVAVLLEVIGASLLAWWWFGEAPSAAAIPATALLLAGVALVVLDAKPSVADVPG
jgi:drug/metabolite transporter (DMT)-like permease